MLISFFCKSSPHKKYLAGYQVRPKGEEFILIMISSDYSMFIFRALYNKTKRAYNSPVLHNKIIYSLLTINNLLIA
jgi:hypothetical protein